MSSKCDRCGQMPGNMLLTIMRQTTSYTPQRAKLCGPCMHEAERFLAGDGIPGLMRKEKTNGKEDETAKEGPQAASGSPVA